MRNTILVAVVLGLTTATSARANPAAEGVFDVSALASEVGRIVRSHYPEAVVTHEGDRIRAEYDARTFLVHHLGKGGRWMAAVEERGPGGRGMVLEVRVVDGPYVSQKQAGVFDERYYVEHRCFEAAPSGDHHLQALLRLPKPAREAPPEGFVDSIPALLRSYADHVTPAGGGDAR